MGQRLSLEVKSKEGISFNVYYHWSGYTEETFKIANSIIQNTNGGVVEIMNELQKSGARLNNEEIRFVLENGILLENDIIRGNVNRNEGLIAFTDKGMKETTNWKENSIFIDFENNKVNFSETLYNVTSISEILENHEHAYKFEKLRCSIEEFPDVYHTIKYRSYFIAYDELFVKVQ